MSIREKCKTQEGGLRLMFWCFTIACLVAAVLSSDRSQMFEGLVRICTQSGQVATGFFDSTYGGHAGTFLNVGLVCFVCVLLTYLPGAKPNGTTALAFFLTGGFSFWGITALSIWFCFPGLIIYSLIKKKPLGTQINAIMFVSGLAPLLTEMLFEYPGTEYHSITFFGICMAILVGSFIGLILPGGLAHSPSMHKGYDLYSAAVPIGLAAFFLRSLLYKVLGNDEILPAAKATLGGASTTAALTFAVLFFVCMILIGRFFLGGSFTDYRKLLHEKGHGVDYSAKYGSGVVAMNLGIYGLFIVAYYSLVNFISPADSVWNAVTLGCVFCMVCCFCNGSHPGNVWPIMVGYFVAAYGMQALASGLGTTHALPIYNQSIIVGVCFANGLSPISGKYGWQYGILAGIAHYVFVTCVPLMHGAFCLYNGGFTAAFVCFLFIPVLEHFVKAKED